MKDTSDLILRQLLGQTTPEENAQLAEWRLQSLENEQLYQRLTDPTYLQREYEKRQMVDTQRALQNMQARIGVHSLFRIRIIRWAAAALLCLAFGITATLYLRHTDSASQMAETIQAGSQRALLTLANGETIELGQDSVRNQELLAEAAPSPDETPAEAENRHNELIVPRGGEFHIVLEDGTEVWLNADSRLTYPEEFSQQERRVSVEGEAYFQVAHNEECPFYVETSGQVVRVLGTEFNVHAYPQDKTVQTTLVSGSIAMYAQGNEGSQLTLAPGRQAVFSKQAHDIHVHSVDTEVVTSWREGMFIFENQSLEEIMRTLSRWYDFEYEFQDEAAAQTEFMGSVTRYGNFDDVLKVLEMSGGLSFRQNGKKLTISSKKA